MRRRPTSMKEETLARSCSLGRWKTSPRTSLDVPPRHCLASRLSIFHRRFRPHQRFRAAPPTTAAARTSAPSRGTSSLRRPASFKISCDQPRLPCGKWKVVVLFKARHSVGSHPHFPHALHVDPHVDPLPSPTDVSFTIFNVRKINAIKKPNANANANRPGFRVSVRRAQLGGRSG
jgi:hypothetical protein